MGTLLTVQCETINESFDDKNDRTEVILLFQPLAASNDTKLEIIQEDESEEQLEYHSRTAESNLLYEAINGNRAVGIAAIRCEKSHYRKLFIVDSSD